MANCVGVSNCYYIFALLDVRVRNVKSVEFLKRRAVVLGPSGGLDLAHGENVLAQRNVVHAVHEDVALAPDEAVEAERSARVRTTFVQGLVQTNALEPQVHSSCTTWSCTT